MRFLRDLYQGILYVTISIWIAFFIFLLYKWVG